MSSTLKSALLLVLAVAMLATPALASARTAGAPEGSSAGGRQIVMHSKRPVSFYRESLRAQLQIDAHLYATPAASAGGGSHELRYALLACLILLAGGVAVASWQLERSSGPEPRIAAAH